MHPPTGQAILALSRFNAKWTARHRLFQRFAPPPWWAPGLVISPSLRYYYELYLPADEFFHDLLNPARLFLPHPSWIPFRTPCTLGQGPAPCPFLSLPDYWQTCPACFAGKLTFNPQELLPLLCAMADPPRFGTDLGRYPQQIRLLQRWLADTPRHSLRILDLGCGTGHGLYEVAELAQAAGIAAISGLGITLSPLEAWMATTRRLPHDPARTRSLRARSQFPKLHIIAADTLAVPTRRRFDLIICNGLAGGRFLKTVPQLRRLLAEMSRILAPGGLVCLANRFHAGCRTPLDEFMKMAAHSGGWQVRGKPNLICLTPVSHPS